MTSAVEVWMLSLPLSQAWKQLALSWLDDVERGRYADFTHEPAAERFLAGRGLARTALSRMLQRPPESIRFTLSAQGKPFLPDQSAAFSLAHTGSLVCLACGAVRRIGIDIEDAERVIQAEAIVSRFFTSAERERWQSLPESERRRAFFRIWTRKEAYLKGTEEGIAGLQRIEVDVRPDNRHPYLSYDGDAQVTKNWWCAEIEPSPGVLVAVAVDGLETEVHRHQLSISTPTD